MNIKKISLFYLYDFTKVIHLLNNFLFYNKYNLFYSYQSFFKNKLNNNEI